MSEEWRPMMQQTMGQFRRPGWRGRWDALVFAVTGKPERTLMQPITISFMAKGNVSVDVLSATEQSGQ
jgi:hypothetical protein